MMRKYISNNVFLLLGILVLCNANRLSAEIIIFDDVMQNDWSEAWQMSYQTFNVHSGTNGIENIENHNMQFTHDGLDVDTNYVLKIWVNTRTEEGVDLLLRLSWTNETETKTDIPFDDRNKDCIYWIDDVPVANSNAVTDADTNTWQCVLVDLTQTNWTGWPYVEHHFDPASNYITEILLTGSPTNSSDKIFLIDDVSLIYTNPVIESFSWENRNEPSDGDTKVLALWHFDDSQSDTSVVDWADNYNLTMFNTNGPDTNGWGTGSSWNSESSSGYLAADRAYFASHDTADINIDWTRDLSISFWCRGSSSMTGQVQSHAFYLGYDNSWSPPRSLMKYTHGYSNPMESRMRSSSTNFGYNFDDDTWHHVGMVYDYDSVSNATVSTYVDNVLQGTFQATDNTIVMQVMRIGCSWEKDIDSIWWGDIDEFLIYQGVLTNFSNGYMSPPPAGTVFHVK